MSREEAKLILAMYRPWADNVDAPEFAEVMAVVNHDPELRAWFKQHCAAQAAIRSSLKRITVPAGLKEQIISEHRAAQAAERWKRRSLVAGVAGVVALLVIVGVIFSGPANAPAEMSFKAFSTRMVKSVRGIYQMDLETSDPGAITNYLAQQQARADYQLPPALAQATSTGCGVLRWQGQRVSMVCFHSGQPLPPGEKTDLFLFVIPSGTATAAPASDKPQLGHVNTFTTASWTRQGLTYLLATPGDEKFLSKFL
jgi:hypothetical protein